MRRRFISALLIAVLSLSALSGCGKSESSSNSASDATTAGMEVSKSDAVETEENTDGTATIEFTFYSDDQEVYYYNFPDTYEIDGTTYYLVEDSEVEYTLTGATRDVIQVALEVEVQDLNEIAGTYTYTSSSGNTYKLTNEQVYIKEEGPITLTLTDTVSYVNKTKEPTYPKTRSISYYDSESGTDKTATATLVSTAVTSSPHWANLFGVAGVFKAPEEDTDTYDIIEVSGVELPDVVVDRDAETPEWETYQSDVIVALGLDSNYYRINSVAWDGEEYVNESDGWIYRNCTFSGDAYVGSYKATYQADVEVNGYKAIVYYRVDADSVNADASDITTVYGVTATVTYTQVAPDGTQ